MPQVLDLGCMLSIPFRSRLLWCASAVTLGAALSASPIQAAPIIKTMSLAVTDLGAPSQFSISFGAPISVAGAASVKITVAGAYGDGTRDGAAISLTNPAVVQVDLGGGTAASAGGAASFAGAGGTTGVVQLNGFGATTLTAAPVNFIILFGQPVGPVENRTLSQGAVAGGIVDGGTNGATVTGQFSGGNIAQFGGGSGNAFIDSYLVGPGPFTDASPFLATGSDILECTSGAPCDQMLTKIDFLQSGDADALAILTRHELGGDELTGDVLATYGANGTGGFDCASIGGCTSLLTTIAFGLSGGGDTAAFAIRVEIDDGTVVPEPSALSLLLAGLALGGVRRRSRPA